MHQQTFSLILDSPESSAACFLLNAPRVFIGRSRENGITLPEATISGKHCEIRQRGDSYEVRDLGSSNGTLLNGTRLNGEAMPLRNGDVLTIGYSTKVRFVKVVEVADTTVDEEDGEHSLEMMDDITRSYKPLINPVAAAMARAAAIQESSPEMRAVG